MVILGLVLIAIGALAIVCGVFTSEVEGTQLQFLGQDIRPVTLFLIGVGSAHPTRQSRVRERSVTATAIFVAGKSAGNRIPRRGLVEARSALQSTGCLCSAPSIAERPPLSTPRAASYLAGSQHASEHENHRTQLAL